MLSVLLGLALTIVAIILGPVLFGWVMGRRVGRSVPAHGRFVVVDGHEVHYVDEGEGQVIVLIHGLGGQMRNFSYSLQQRLASRYRVITLDRPGSGHSILRRGSSRSIRAQGDIVSGLIRALSLQRPLLVGHSLGGTVALAVALDDPETISGVALISPMTQVLDTAPAVFKALEIQSKAVRWIVAWTLAVPMSMANGAQVLEAIFAPDAVPQDFGTAGGSLLGLRPSSFYSTSSELMSIPADLPWMLERYPGLSVPVAILFGRSDAVLDPEIHGTRLMEQVPGSQLHLISGGHMLPVSAPGQVAAWINEFASKLAQNASLGAEVSRG